MSLIGYNSTNKIAIKDIYIIQLVFLNETNEVLPSDVDEMTDP